MSKNMEQQIGDMNDNEIQEYVNSLAPYTRHEEKHKWTMVYNGDTIKHWSYCKFIQWGISDKNVSNITITDALFIDIDFYDCVFDNVQFENCVFNDITLNLYFQELQPLDVNNELTVTEKTNTIIDGINSLSPLVANKVLESMTGDEIRALVGLKSIIIAETPIETATLPGKACFSL